jgi:clan AA aspartic protease
MGITTADLVLTNPAQQQLAPVTVKAIADTGALLLCIPESVALQLRLDLSAAEWRIATTADGKQHPVPYVGPLQVRCGNRSGYFGALVIGTEVLLGAVVMEDLDLVVSPRDQRVIPNPANPNFATAVVLDVRPPRS